MEFSQSEIFTRVVLGNTIEQYLLVFGVLLGSLVTLKIFREIVLHNLEKFSKRSETRIDDAAIRIIRSIHPPFYFFLALYFSLRVLALSELVRDVLFGILLIWAVYQATFATQVLIDYIFKKFIRKEDEKSAQASLGALKMVVKGALWVIGILLVLQNLGLNITSVIAGLGIGGIAVALAAQNILSDLFSSFAIIFDKPFQPGDFIVVGEHSGTVKKIGIKTTRIKSLSGEEIVISNKELTSARVQNYRHMRERRIAFKIGVTYGTSSDLLKNTPQIIERIVKSVENTRFDRVHFVSFGASSLEFEVVYFVTTKEFRAYRDAHQEILLKIKQEFEKKKIVFAYPTQTVYLAK